MLRGGGFFDWSVANEREAAVGPVVLVTGAADLAAVVAHVAEEGGGPLADGRLIVVDNPAWTSGQMSSIRRGIDTADRLGADRVGRALLRAGARTFFVAVAEEGAALRAALGPGPEILVFSGHMPGDTDMIGDLDLVPMLNSIEQVTRQPRQPLAFRPDHNCHRFGQ